LADREAPGDRAQPAPQSGWQKLRPSCNFETSTRVVSEGMSNCASPHTRGIGSHCDIEISVYPIDIPMHRNTFSEIGYVPSQ